MSTRFEVSNIGPAADVGSRAWNGTVSATIEHFVAEVAAKGAIDVEGAAPQVACSVSNHRELHARW
jgi:hypothetical protein